MTNAELIAELEDARAKREAIYAQFIALDDNGASFEEMATVEKVMIEYEEDIKHLVNEVNYRLNWEPKGAWR